MIQPSLLETGKPRSHLTTLPAQDRTGVSPRCTKDHRMRLRDVTILFVLTALFFGLFLGSRPLSVPDEGRYVEISREMAVTGDWLTPRLNGVLYFEKPPLFYWFEAGMIRLFGLSEWSVRIGPALFALFGCLAVYYAGTRMFGRLAGLLSAAVLATSILYYALSRLITLDMPVSALLTASLLSFLLGTREPPGGARRLFFRGFFVFAALATLTKGLIGIVLPGMIAVAWMALLNEWRVLRSMHLVSGALIFLAIAAPWHILVQQANPGFFQFYFIHEHFERYLTNVHGRFKPFWFFFPIVMLCLFPWSAFLVHAVKHNLPPTWKDRSQRKDVLFLLLWAGIVILFFSASGSKLIPYILPVLPPLALLIGKYLADAWDKSDAPGFRSGAIVFSVSCALLGMAVAAIPSYLPEAGSPGVRTALYTMALWLAMTGIAALITWSGRTPAVKSAVPLIVVATAVVYLLAGAIAPVFDSRSLKPLALVLKPLLRPGDDVVHYRNYYQDLPVYLERRMTIAAWKGELAFGATIEDAGSWIIDETELWRRWNGPTRTFLVAGVRDADAVRKKPDMPFFLIARNKNTVILSNRAVEP